jgi:hypothetical protein
MKRLLCLCMILIGGALGTGSAGADPVGGNCPNETSGFVVWDVDTQPYQVDNAVDANGNGDGIVCAKPVDSLTFVFEGQTFQVYNFIEDVIR